MIYLECTLNLLAKSNPDLLNQILLNGKAKTTSTGINYILC